MADGKTYDAVVVGGGPAGATSAYCLAKAGLNVCIVDKQTFPRPKLCAGLLTWKTVQALKTIFGLSIDDLRTAGLVRHRVDAYRIYFHRSELARGILDYPFHMVDRQDYDHFWLKQSIAAGSRFINACRVRNVDPETGRVYLDNGDAICGRIIVGADGAWSVVRRSIFASPAQHRRWRSQLAMTIETRCPTARPPSFASLHFGYVPWGYAWAFPHRDHQIVGIGSLRHKDDRPFKEGFGQFMEAIGLKECASAPWRGHPLPFGNYLTTPGRYRVLLVGDACGLADPLLGEGVYYAHRSGELAARSILCRNASIDGINRHYRRSLVRHVIRELRWIKFYRNLLFVGGHRRRFRGLKLFFRLFPKRLEAAIHGQISFGRILGL